MKNEKNDINLTVKNYNGKDELDSFFENILKNNPQMEEFRQNLKLIKNELMKKYPNLIINNKNENYCIKNENKGNDNNADEIRDMNEHDIEEEKKAKDKISNEENKHKKRSHNEYILDKKDIIKILFKFLINKKEYENLKKDNEKLKVDIERKELEKKVKDEENEKLKKELKTTEFEYKIKNEENEKIKEDFKDKEVEYSNIIKNKKEEIIKLEDDFKTREKEFTKEVNNKNKEISNLMETLIKKENEYKIEIKNKENDIEQLKKDLQNISKELIKIKEEKESKKEEITKLILEINGKTYTNNNLRKILENEKNINIVNNNIIKEKERLIKKYEDKFRLLQDIISNKDDENYRPKCLNKKEEKKAQHENNEENNFDKYGQIGIYNEELNCYMSSILQILKNIQNFSLVFINIKSEDNIIKSLQKLFSNLFYSEEKSVSLHEFKSYFSQEYIKFKGIHTNDSTFFLIYLIQYLHKSFIKPKKDIIFNYNEFIKIGLENQEIEEFKKFLCRYESKNNSFIHDLFFGYQMNKILCTGCNDFHNSFQSFNILDLPLLDENKKLKSLEECLNCFLITKDLKGNPGFKCSKCKQKLLSHQTSILKLPSILIINLKRVGENVVHYHDIEIPFILKTSSIDKLKKFYKNFELLGFVKHNGTEKNGHNIAYSKNIFNNKWYIYNDTKVKEVNEFPSTEKSFLLFYQIKGNS